MPYVYSTATGGIDYVKYKPSSDRANHNEVVKKVSIAGGANLAPVVGRLITPRGVVTKVSEKDLEFLLQDEAFKRHMEAGFMHVEKENLDADKVAKKMTARDASAPITPDSKEVLGTAVPVVPPAPANRKA